MHFLFRTTAVTTREHRLMHLADKIDKPAENPGTSMVDPEAKINDVMKKVDPTTLPEMEKVRDAAVGLSASVRDIRDNPPKSADELWSRMDAQKDDLKTVGPELRKAYAESVAEVMGAGYLVIIHENGDDTFTVIAEEKKDAVAADVPTSDLTDQDKISLDELITTPNISGGGQPLIEFQKRYDALVAAGIDTAPFVEALNKELGKAKDVEITITVVAGKLEVAVEPKEPTKPAVSAAPGGATIDVLPSNEENDVAMLNEFIDDLSTKEAKEALQRLQTHYTTLTADQQKQFRAEASSLMVDFGYHMVDVGGVLKIEPLPLNNHDQIMIEEIINHPDTDSTLQVLELNKTFAGLSVSGKKGFVELLNLKLKEKGVKKAFRADGDTLVLEDVAAAPKPAYELTDANKQVLKALLEALHSGDKAKRTAPMAELQKIYDDLKQKNSLLGIASFLQQINAFIDLDATASAYSIKVEANVLKLEEPTPAKLADSLKSSGGLFELIANLLEALKGILNGTSTASGKAPALTPGAGGKRTDRTPRPVHTDKPGPVKKAKVYLPTTDVYTGGSAPSRPMFGVTENFGLFGNRAEGVIVTSMIDGVPHKTTLPPPEKDRFGNYRPVSVAIPGGRVSLSEHGFWKIEPGSSNVSFYMQHQADDVPETMIVSGGKVSTPGSQAHARAQQEALAASRREGNAGNREKAIDAMARGVTPATASRLYGVPLQDVYSSKMENQYLDRRFEMMRDRGLV